MFGSSARARVIRTAVLFTPLFAAALLLMLLSVTGIWSGGPVLFVILLILAVLFGYQSIQALRDLRAPLVTTRGPVHRIWSKMDLVVTRSHYIAVGRHIFHVPFPAWYDLRDEAKRMRDAELDKDYLMEVEVQHYPHTGTVERVERVGQVRVESDEPARGRR